MSLENRTWSRKRLFSDEDALQKIWDGARQNGSPEIRTFTTTEAIDVLGIGRKSVMNYLTKFVRSSSISRINRGEYEIKYPGSDSLSATFEHILDSYSKRWPLSGLDLFVGSSDGSQRVLKSIQVAAFARVGRDDLAPVMITGETGTGKELVARLIHQLGPRGSEEFCAVNCTALAETLLESELFGHEKGAFTGATNIKQGAFEHASDGTLFLDEMGDSGLTFQAKILRVLEDGYFNRIGSWRPIKSTARIIAATNKNLREEITAKRFRDDLFYRLNVFPIHIPPLRERREDILPLVAFFVLKRRDELKVCPKLNSGALQKIMRHSWGGNVRELRNVLQHAFILAESEDAEVEDRHIQF